MKNISLNLTAILILLIIGIITGYSIHSKFHSCKTEFISLTEEQTASIIQQAQFNMISIDSAKALIKQETKIHWIDSLRLTTLYNYKDSLNLRDSVLFNVPIYEADSTFDIAGEQGEYKANLNLTLHQRFLPLQELFASGIKVNSFSFKLPDKKKKWYEHFNLVIGGGVIGDNTKIGFGAFCGIGYEIF